MSLTQPPQAQNLSTSDLAICRAFAYKVHTNTTDDAFQMLPYAFPSEPPLPTLDAIRSRVAFLAGFRPIQYDQCPNACCCFVGPHANLSRCPFCTEPRYRSDGKPRQKYTYMPIIPRLINLVGNRDMAKQMEYRARVHTHTPGIIKDVFDGTLYRGLQGRQVRVNGRTFAHKYFEDPRDIALGISTDGFSTFKTRKQSTWAFIVFNYNLPPDIRFHLQNIITLGVVGPRKPIDFDSFLWPAVQELLELLFGVRAFDALTSTVFCLRAFLLLAFGDIPAIAALMRMKGHNGVLPCRMCKIIGLRIPGSRSTTHYVPLERSSHPDVQGTSNAVTTYDANNLPMRNHDEMFSQANEVQDAFTNTGAADLAKAYGINGISILFYLPPIIFPICFPYDFMHLIWENLIPNLVLLWTGNFKGLGPGTASYEIPKAVWEAIGEATAAAGSTIPSVYGCRVPSIAKDQSQYTAEMWSFWTLYLGPVVLRRRFQRPKYYDHFINLVCLLNTCLKFEITEDDIKQIRVGFMEWVNEYEL